jgi:lysophospholipase L1-like esterase
MSVFRAAIALTPFLVLAAGPAAAEEKKAPDWVAPMRKAHAKFTGTPGTLALFGDSITVSMAFWAGLPHTRRNMPPEGEAAYKLVSSYMKKEGWTGRGARFGNEGGMTVRWAYDNVDAWLKRLNPETAVIMFGTNDLGSVPLGEYEKKLRAVVRKCVANGTVPIVTTIPPRSGLLERSKQFAEAARRVAREEKVPLCDYFAECLKRRPDDWDGALPKFKGLATYEAPTVISRDGVHPSNPRKYNGDYSAEGLRSNGFVLRNWVTLLAYAEVIREVYRVR